MSVFRGSVLLLALFIGLPASAQVVTSSTGAINGVVTDTSKAVLPGVTVTAQSPQMMGTRETVTDEQGKYQFAAIPPGEYTVKFELPGFATMVRENIRIVISFTGTVNVELPLAAQQETITVTGQSPVVDTTATKLTNNFDAQTLSNLPTARDLPSLLAETPGVVMTRVDVGGSVAMTEVGFQIYGMSGSNYMRTEGVVAPSQQNHYQDVGAVDEVQIETAAHTAEMPFAGVYTNMISKSGGNTYHVTFYKDYETKKWGTTNIDDAQVSAGVTGGVKLAAKDTNKVSDYQDTNLGVGGYILKDKLWWFGSLRDNRNHVAFVSLPDELVVTKIFAKQIKTTYTPASSHKFIFFLSSNLKKLPNHFNNASNFYSANSTEDEDFPIRQAKIEYNAVLSSAAFLEVRWGRYYKDVYYYSKLPATPRYEDQSTLAITGSTIAHWNSDLRPQINGSLSYFKKGWGNSHNVKIGWDVGRYRRPEQFDSGLDSRDGPTGLPDIIYTLNNGAPSQVKFNLSPSFALAEQWTYSAFLNDSWQLNDRFSFNLGIRFDRYRNAYPAFTHPADQFGGRILPAAVSVPANSDSIHFNSIGPRVGMVWNTNGDGRTVIKGSWGSYGTLPGVTLANVGSGIWSRTYAWTDLDRDLLWEPGEEGRLISSVGGVANSLIDPNLKLAQTTELATWLERELMTNLAIRTGLVYRRNTNNQIALNLNRPLSAFNIPVSICVPGTNGRVDDPATCPRLTVYDLSAAALAAPIASTTTNNTLTDPEHFTTWEISGTKRMTNHWSLNASFTETWSAQFQAPRGLGSGAQPTNPNQFIGAESDGLFHFTTSQAKVTSTIQFPRDIRFSPVYRYQAGYQYGRTISVQRNYGLETIQVEPTSARRSDNLNILDVRIEKGLTFGKARWGLFVDVFNAFNSNAAQAINQSSSATFLRPNAIIPPRIARVGTKLEW